ncbi:MAG: hypothetical protein NT169_04695 [Chloroflexi bacterium]|nr:hypothetical protein [Chloroflexota bacterium]
MIFSGSGAQNLDASVATTFNNLTVNSGVTLVETVSADNVTVAGTLTNSGTIRKTQSVSGAGSKTFGLAGRYNGADLSVNVTTQGSLSQLQVDRVDSNHPNAVAATQTGRYWSITPTGSSYTIDLTLPHNVSTPGTNAYVCRNTGGTNWMCGRTSATANTVTRTELTTLSDWAVGDSSKGPLAVRLANFQATVAGHQVVVTWETVSELDVQGFHLYRAESAAGPWQRLDAGLIPSAAPGSANGHTYAFSDRDVQGGRTYWYRLEAVDLAGGIQALGLTSVTVRPTAAAPRLWLPWVGW